MGEVDTCSSAVELATALRAGRIGSRELLDAYTERVAGPGADLNAVVTLDLERAREVAAERDAQHARAESAGPCTACRSRSRTRSRSRACVRRAVRSSWPTMSRPGTLPRYAGCARPAR